MAVILLVFSISSVSGVMPSEMVLPSPSSQVNCKNRIYFQCDDADEDQESADSWSVSGVDQA